jgi:hypothetical protein
MKPLTEKQEAHIIEYIDQKLLDIARGYRKRSILSRYSQQSQINADKALWRPLSRFQI